MVMMRSTQFPAYPFLAPERKRNIASNNKNADGKFEEKLVGRTCSLALYGTCHKPHPRSHESEKF